MTTADDTALDARDAYGRTALYCVAKRRDTEEVKRLVAQGANVHAVTESGKSVLNASARAGDIEAVEFLVSRGADVNAMDTLGRSVLYAATRKARVEVMKLLIERGADIHATTEDGRTVLHAVAAHIDDCDVLEYLLGHDIDLQAADEDGSTALYEAALNGHVECMKLLAERGADIYTTTNDGRTVFHAAAANVADVGALEYLLEHGADIDATDEDGWTALYDTAMNGRVECMKFLVQRGADILSATMDGRTVLHAAAANLDDVGAWECLLEHGADVHATDEDGWTALYEAARNGRVACMKLLLESGASIDAATNNGRTVLHAAAANTDDTTALEHLLEHGGDIDATDEDGLTPLYDTVLNGRLESMKCLIRHGAGIHATTKTGRTLLHAAIGVIEDSSALEYLLDLGVGINATDEDGRTALYDAAMNGRADCVKILAQRGADIRATTRDGRTVLHAVAANIDDADVLKLLIELGADINATDEDDSTPLYEAAKNGHLAAMELLVQRGSDLHATTKIGDTILLAASRSRNADVVKFTLEKGLAIDPTNSDGDSPLHFVAFYNGDVATMHLLIENGADIYAVNAKGQTALHYAIKGRELQAAEYLVKRGLLIDTPDEDGLAAVHFAAMIGNGIMLRFLVEHGANIHVLTKAKWSILYYAIKHTNVRTLEYVIDLGVSINPFHEGDEDFTSPLLLAICESTHEDAYSMALTLCSRGASLSDQDRRMLLKGIQVAVKDDGSSEEAETSENQEQWRQGLVMCVDKWTGEHLAGAEVLTKIPVEVIERGEASVKAYLNDVARSSRDELINRCKVCVVGPSEWGKTSFVQSITTGTQFLTALEDRTIGIDLTKCLLAGGDGSHDEITFWDFAGQDMYQSVHAMFFSRRTLFVLGVNLKAYSNELRLAEANSDQESELQMNRFVRSQIFKWVRAIFAYQPDARFVVVGTKVDLLEDPGAVEEVWDDLKDRLVDWKADFVKDIKRQINAKASDTKKMTDLQAKLAQIASDDWLVANITSVDSIEVVRAALKQRIASDDLGFPMWKMYRQVLEAVLKRREAVRHAGSARERIEKSIIRFRTLRKQLLREIDELQRDDCEQILRTLNDLGDVLWYEHEGAGVFKDYLILDPMLVIDVVREVVRHDFPRNTGLESTGDGRIPNTLLSTFPLWRDMDKELTHAFKALLQHFQLAYPADAESMLPESDLIVPAYWAANKEARIRTFTTQKTVCDAFVTHRWCWEYEVPGGLAETIFEKFAVLSHSSYLKRTIRGFCMEAACSEFATSISLHLGHSSRDVIRIEVSGETAELSWHNMRFYLMKMEKVLEVYRGDVIWRYIVHKEAETDQEWRHSVSALVKLLEDTIVMGRNVEEVRAKTPGMPPDMDWFMRKSWNDISSFQQLQMNELVRSKMLVLEKLAIAGDAPRRLPALWSLEFLAAEQKAVVRMHSDLTGHCYHVPIEIDTGSPMLARHTALFKEGLSVCATIVGSALSFPIVQNVVEAAKSALNAKADQVERVHNLIAKLDLSTRSQIFDARETSLSPGASLLLLRDLLNVYNDGLDELEISQASNLVCAVTSNGEYVWAHAHEIAALKGQLTMCSSPPSTWADLDQPERSPTLREPGVALTNLTASTSSTAWSRHTSSNALRLVLCVEAIEGLADWDCHKTYCKWQLYHGKSRVPIASDVTPENEDSSSVPSWRAMKVSIESVASVAMLRECRLAVQVKRRSRIGWTKLIGEGEILMKDVVVEDVGGRFECDPIHVVLDEATRQVVIHLTA